MNNSNDDDYSERQSQELNQLERDAEEAGRSAMGNPLDQGREMTDNEQVTVASALAQMYLQKYIEHLDSRGITDYMLLYLRCFILGYNKAKSESALLTSQITGR